MYFCTLFDSKYLTRGLAMYESLKRHCFDFHLFVFPFDSDSLKVLSHLKLEFVTIIPLSDFEDERLLSIKETRSKGEYCWTSTSSTILYCIEKFNLNHCIYLDADLYFYNSPSLLLNEVDGKSILITDHRYSPQYNRSYESGKYCVQFVFFRNDVNGIKALRWWRNSCIEWCYNRLEDNKFGDQKYLDDWTVRFDGVAELKNLGGGVAPWNVQQYRILENLNKYEIEELSTKDRYSLVFYHFHELKFISGFKIVNIGGYYISTKIKNKIYKPYIRHLYTLNRKLNSEFPDIKSQEFRTICLKEKIRLFIYHVLRRERNLVFQKIFKKNR